jgi:hypothetical protein
MRISFRCCVLFEMYGAIGRWVLTQFVWLYWRITIARSIVCRRCCCVDVSHLGLSWTWIIDCLAKQPLMSIVVCIRVRFIYMMRRRLCFFHLNTICFTHADVCSLYISYTCWSGVNVFRLSSAAKMVIVIIQKVVQRTPPTNDFRIHVIQKKNHYTAISLTHQVLRS